MNRLIEAQPTAIRHMLDATLFYFGSQTPDINLLPGKAKFEIVYSPREGSGWELVSYQWFEEKNGLAVLERRLLETDEITYFERLLAATKKKTGTQPLTIGAGV